MADTINIPEKYWSLPQDALVSQLQSSDDGLQSGEADRRLQLFGPNQLQVREQASAIGLFLNQFKSPIVLILLGATLVSAILKDWVDAAIILLIVLGSAILSFVQEYNANSAAEKLREQITLKVNVLRDHQPRSILAAHVVPGDVVLLSAGSLIPADGVVLEAKDFFVNQAVLTGETFPVEKQPGPTKADASLGERTNTAYMGTSVRSGSARMLVAQTGRDTVFGQVAKRLVLRPPETEFERGVKHLGYLLSEVMFILVFAIFALNIAFHKPFLDSLLFSIALAVGLTPQLLPAIININLSQGSRDMARAGVIVRQLESIENFGNMDVLCTDKTGTLTEGVVQLDAALDISGNTSKEVLRYAFLNALNHTGLDNPLDQAILDKAGGTVESAHKIDEIPYDFVRKRMSVILQDESAETTGSYLMITKGALEGVLSICTSIQLQTQVLPLDEVQHVPLMQHYNEWSEQGYRVLGVAYKSVHAKEGSYNREDERDLIFAGFLLFFDPPKQGVKEIIQTLAHLGVQLKVITGDNRLVAAHIAEAVGLDSSMVITGAQLEEMHDEALWHSAEKTSIFAEVDPNQKERIILALKKAGHVVGYMGDGINDAPALHSADVGISVNNAVDVAKEAASLVLLKQDLGVLQQGIELGRKTFANTLKYVFMATSANFGNMFSMAGASLFLPFLPMLPKQILLINFLTDLPEMTIAGDNVDPIYIQQPHRWNIAFIRRFMLVFGPLSSFFDFLTFAILLWISRTNEALFHTGWFVESVISATLVVFVLRTRLPFWRSRPSKAMLAATSGVALVTLALPYSPLAQLLDFQPLPPILLLIIGCIVGLYFLTAEVVKRWFFRSYRGRF